MSVASYIALVMGEIKSNLTEDTMSTLNIDFSQSITAEYARPNGISLCHAFNPKGGVTIAYRKGNEFKNCRMVEVALAYCSPTDVFNKKIGSTRATQNFLEGATVLIPIRRPEDEWGLVEQLRRMFWYNLDVTNL